MNDYIKNIVDVVHKKHGRESMITFDPDSAVDVEAISSQSLLLDAALGVGGYPKGRVVEIYGPESSGKTTLAIHAVAEAQKHDQVAAFIDVEHAFDPVYAASIGVDVENLLFSQPNTGEEALELVDTLLNTKQVGIIVIDSVAALVPRAELDGEMGDSKMGLQARLMSQALRKITGIIGKSKCCVIFINQLREKIGVMFGSPEVTAGGNALKYYASVRLDIRRKAYIKDKQGNHTGTHARVKVIKNKVAPPFREAELTIVFGEGISLEHEVLEAGVELEIINKSGSWFSYDGSKLGQGKDAVVSILKDNPELCEEIYQRIVHEL